MGLGILTSLKSLPKNAKGINAYKNVTGYNASAKRAYKRGILEERELNVIVVFWVVYHRINR